jgi:hypothetical protein
MDNLQSIFLSKNNVAQLYQHLLSKHNLGGLEQAKKQMITSRLVNLMKTTYEKMDKSRVNSNTLPGIVSKYNEVIVRRMDESIAGSMGVDQMKMRRDIELNGNRNIVVPTRPEYNMRGNEREMSNNMRENFVNNNRQNTVFNPLGERVERPGVTPQERLKQLEDARNRDIPMRNRPTTPDFSLDGAGKKQQQQMLQQTAPRQVAPIQKTPINVAQDNDIDLMAINNVDEESNLDVWNTGINYNNIVEDTTPLEVKLQMMEQERSTINNSTEYSAPPRPARHAPPPPPPPAVKRAAPPTQPKHVVRDDDYDVESILKQQKDMYEKEMMKMKQALTAEANQYRMENDMLNKEVERLSQQSMEEEDDKMTRLEQKKGEILQELDRLHNKHAELEQAMNKNTELLKQLEEKREEVRKIAAKYKTHEHIEVLSSEECTNLYDGTLRYIYDVKQGYDEIVSVEVNDFDIPHPLYNVHKDNNKLYLNDAVLEVEEGNYDIGTLIAAVEELAPQLALKVSKVNNKVTVSSEEDFVIHKRDDDILGMLGITATGDKPVKKISGTKPYNLPRETSVNVYANDEHIGTLSLNTHKIFNKNKSISLTDKLEIHICTSNNKPINYHVNHHLELVIKTRNSDFI